MTATVDLTLRRTLEPDGAATGPIPDIGDETLVELYRLMKVTRQIDRRALAAQRQGRIGTYAMSEGHEAVHIGSALAFAESDFIYPAYRQHPVQLARGMPPEVVYSYWRGLPTEQWDVTQYRMMTIAVPIATQIPQAVGHAYATRRRGEDTVVGTYFGEGATSETDFHSGLNFAGVWQTPNVFICENNLYAISVPYSKQTGSETVAQKAHAYGISGVRVEGMDVLAVYQVTREAVDRARRFACFAHGTPATIGDSGVRLAHCNPCHAVRSPARASSGD